MAEGQSFLVRHEFIIRRLHSLSGLIPVGAYMVIHLMVNASVSDDPSTFQSAVYGIHKLPALWVIEWGFIFLPILFHAIIGVIIIRGGLPNSSSYAYTSNIRYTLQRATGMIAFLFILWHVFHMHGWLHIDPWLKHVAEPLGGHQFRPYNASSTAAAALQASWIIPVLYGIGMLACVYHLANGIWTMGITWGVWVTPRAQKWANYACGGIGVALAVIGLISIVGFSKVNIEAARQRENNWLEKRIETGDVKEDPDKTWQPEDNSNSEARLGESPQNAE